jgi:hypothetical protein
MSCFLLRVGIVGGAGLAASGYQAGGPARRDTPLVSEAPTQHYLLCGGLRATLQGHEVAITTAKGVLIARNKQLIRLATDARDCPLDGFYAIVTKGNYFTIEQQNCSGWFFINEYMTFRYVPNTRKIELYKFGLTFTDRRAPNKIIPDKIFTNKQFGQRHFGQVTLAELEALDH